MRKIYIGFDVGINGCAAALDENGELVGAIALPHIKEVPCYRKGKTRSVLDLLKLIKWLNNFGQITSFCAEESAGWGMGIVSATTSAYNNGLLHGLCKGVYPAVPFKTVAAKTWQKDLFPDETWSKSFSIDQAILKHGELTMFRRPRRTADGYADSCHIAEWSRIQCQQKN